MQNNKSDNLVIKLSFDFSLKVLKYVAAMNPDYRSSIGQQLLKSATSIRANVREAQNAESKADFIHKFKIAAKEADETEYWLELCNHSGEFDPCFELLNDIGALIRVLSKIISTAKQKG